MSAHTDLGAWGEFLVARHLRPLGHIEPAHHADVRLVIEALGSAVELEVKTARLSAYNGQTPGYQFCLTRKTPTRVKTTPKAPLVILICAPEGCHGDPAGVFVIPAEKIRHLSKVGLPHDLSNYAGRYARYRDRWDLIANYLEAQ